MSQEVMLQVEQLQEVVPVALQQILHTYSQVIQAQVIPHIVVQATVLTVVVVIAVALVVVVQAVALAALVNIIFPIFNNKKRPRGLYFLNLGLLISIESIT